MALTRNSADPLAAMRRLHRARQVLEAAADADARAVGADLMRYLEPGATMTLDEAMGLAARPGGESWRAAAARERRDHALRQLAAFLPGLSAAATADQVGRLAKRYATTRWRRADQHAGGILPSGYGGTPNEWLFAAFVAGAGQVPTGSTQLRRILATPCEEREIPAAQREGFQRQPIAAVCKSTIREAAE